MSALFPLIAAPALPLHAAGKYVAGAYIVAFVIIAAYVAIMARRLNNMERSLENLATEDADAGLAEHSGSGTAR